jgi:hypothetical protein
MSSDKLAIPCQIGVKAHRDRRFGDNGMLHPLRRKELFSRQLIQPRWPVSTSDADAVFPDMTNLPPTIWPSSGGHYFQHFRNGPEILPLELWRPNSRDSSPVLRSLDARPFRQRYARDE